MVSPLEDLFARALGLQTPWQLARVTFSEQVRELALDSGRLSQLMT